VHAVLQVTDLATGDNLDALSRAQAAAEGIPERSADIASLARAALNSETVRRAATLRHWREVPVGASVDGTVFEGFIDLLYEERDGSVVIVDYKTDSVSRAGIATRMEKYRLQGAVYAMLLQKVMGRRALRVEFVFAGVGETRAIVDLEAAVDEVLAAVAGTNAPEGAAPSPAWSPRVCIETTYVAARSIDISDTPCNSSCSNADTSSMPNQRSRPGPSRAPHAFSGQCRIARRGPKRTPSRGRRQAAAADRTE